MARADFEGAIRRGAAGDAGACAEGAEARQGWEQVPAERAAEVRRVRQALSRPREPRAASSPTTSAAPCSPKEPGTCTARYLNAPRVEDFVVEKIRERILTEETIVKLVQLVAEEIDAMAGRAVRQAGGGRGGARGREEAA